MTEWTIVTDPAHGITLHVPKTAASGAAVDVTIDRDADAHRIHAQTADGSEVYVEVVSSAGIVDNGQAVTEQRDALRVRSPGARISEPTSTRVLGRPAATFDFSGLLGGTRRVRRFLLVEAGVRTVRIVFDPTSPENDAILGTLAIA